MKKYFFTLLVIVSFIQLNAQFVFQNMAVKKMPVVPITYNFNYTGVLQKFIVPNKVTSIQINSIGATGGTGAGGQPGGAGANITTTLNVTPGQILYIVVGGYPGQSATATYGFAGNGGIAVSSSNNGAAGGGLSGVFTSNTPAISNALVVAGGGGGGGGAAGTSGYTGGAALNASTGSASNGVGGTSWPVSGRYQYGYGASTSGVGVGGYAYDSYPTQNGADGSGINGGAGGPAASGWNGGGGGGAGYYGGGAGAGGGGANGGGGGGASYSITGISSFGTANASGNGSVSIKCIYNSNIVFQLDASNSLSYSSSSSTIWKDLIGTNDATLYGSSFNSPSIGLTFNGTTSQYGSIPSVSGITDFTNTQQYTIELWFNPSNGQVTSSEAEVLEKWNKNNESRYPFTIRYNEGTSSMLAACYDGTSFTNISAAGFSVNTWKQFVCVFDFVAKTLTIYRDGTAVGNTSLVGVNQVSNTSPVCIASRLNSSNAAQSSIMFKGTIGIVRIYNAALTANQVLQNFNANRARFGL